MTAPSPRVRVAIPTYRRPQLLPRLISEVGEHAGRAETELDWGPQVDVLVIDNDPAGSAAQAGLEALSPRVTVVTEPSPGIAAARQRALDESAEHDVLVFIDDDERPCPDWLTPLLDTWRRTRAAAVPGRVLAEFDAAPDEWIVAGRFFERTFHPTGTAVPAAPAGNLLLDLGQVRRLGVRFRPELGLSGGEDTLFTRQLHARGGTIVWCAESGIVDLVPVERMTREWVLRRRYSHGVTAATVDLLLADGPRARAAVRIRHTAAGVVQLLGGHSRALWGRATRSVEHDARGRRTAARGAGRLAGARGVTYVEYARPGGES